MDDLDSISAAIDLAIDAGRSVDIIGGGSKRFLGYPPSSDSIACNVSGHRGILDYHPEELVIRVRSGTPLVELIDLLREQGQMLPFEPPDFNGAATIGGAVATGLSGSRRPFCGSVKDSILGVGLLQADGISKQFGGQVMKNVAGYDVSRLIVGSYGTLGVIADVSLKVLPRPEDEQTIRLSLALADARKLVLSYRRQVNPVSGICYVDGQLMLRLSGTAISVARAMATLGGETSSNEFWLDVDNHKLASFRAARAVWRLSTHPHEAIGEDKFAMMDWGFAQRWLLDPEVDPRIGYQGKGHWTLYQKPIDDVTGEIFSEINGSAMDRPEIAHPAIFHPVSDTQMTLQQNIKKVFDPGGIFNPGRMYRGIY